MAKRNIVSCCIGAIICSVLLWTVYPPVGAAWVVFVAVSPLLAVSRFCTPGRAAAIWGLAGILFWGANLSWFFSLRHYDVSAGFICLGGIVGPVFRTFFFSLFGWLSSWMWRGVRRSGSARWRMAAVLVAEPFLWAGCEWLRFSLIPGLECVYLGTAVCQIPGMAWPARWGGEYLLSALAVLLNGALVTAVSSFAGEGVRKALPYAVMPCVVTITLCFAVRPGSADNPTKPLDVVLVQRNAPLKRQTVKMLRDGFDPYARYAELLAGVTNGPTDIVVLPEGALNEFGSDVRGDEAWKAAEFIAARAGAKAVLAGGRSVSPSLRGKHVQSAAALYEVPRREGDVEPEVYIKRKLVPFGEYNPLAVWIPALRDVSYFVEKPGDRAAVFRFGYFRVAPLMCSDCFVPRYARESAAAGAQVIAMISNDLWYTPSAQPVQHVWQAVARGVETGLPVICAGNVGVTGVAFPDGSARWLTDDRTGGPLMREPGVMRETVNVPLLPVRTPYTRFGDVPVLLLAVLAAGFAVKTGMGKKS